MTDRVLSIQGLTKHFGGILALNGLSFGVGREGIYSIIGPNGAGKTTLFNCISGVLRPDGGKILFQGEDITGLKGHEIVELGIARTFQNIRLFSNMTVLENVLVGMHSRLRSNFWQTISRSHYQRLEEKSALKRAYQLLDYVGLKGLEDKLATSLPYGLQRRLELARALASSPKLLLLDEPTAGMLPSESKEIAELLKRIQWEFGISILLIEHDMKVVMDVSSKIIVLDLGEKIAEGSPDEIRSDERVIQAYLGGKGKHPL